MIFRKACTCWPATASTGQLRLTQDVTALDVDTDIRVVFKLRLVPGPSCDVCGRAWTCDDPEAPRLVEAR